MVHKNFKGFYDQFVHMELHRNCLLMLMKGQPSACILLPASVSIVASWRPLTGQLTVPLPVPRGCQRGVHIIYSTPIRVVTGKMLHWERFSFRPLCPAMLNYAASKPGQRTRPIPPPPLPSLLLKLTRQRSVNEQNITQIC